MSQMGKTVAVIGAGVAGLFSAKYATEAGLVPTVFEQLPQIGGTWSPCSDYLPQSLRTNISKHCMTAADFSWESAIPEYNVPLFPEASQVGKYLQAYAQHFLDPRLIRCSTTVTRAEFNLNKNQWQIKFCQLGKDATEISTKVEYFDFLIVASGYLSQAYLPPVPGMSDKFCPVYDYSQAEIALRKGFLDLSEKRVVVIGGSISGVDLTGNLWKYNPAQILHIVKKPYWILPRFVPENPSSRSPSFLPVDLVLLSKIPREQNDATMSLGSPSVQDLNRVANSALRTFAGGQCALATALDIKDDEPMFVSVSDTYVEMVRDGALEVMLGELVAIDETVLRIRQQNEQIEIPHANSIVLTATGFTAKLPFFSKEILASIDFNERNLFQPLTLANGILHPNLPNTAFVGMFRATYFGIMELQARYAASLFTGRVPWPSVIDQQNSLENENRIGNQWPRQQLPYPSYVECFMKYVKFGQFAECSEVEYAIPSKYSSTPESALVLKGLDSDLLSMKSGRYTPAAIFRILAGTWKIERGSGPSKSAKFSRKEGQSDVFLYSQDNEHSNESYEYNCVSETLSLRKNHVRAPIVFERKAEIGWKGTSTIVIDNCQWHFEFLFPFHGTYCNTFTKKVVLQTGEGQEVITNYRR